MLPVELTFLCILFHLLSPFFPAWNAIVGKVLPMSAAIGAGSGAGAGILAGWSSLLVQVRVIEAAKL